MFDTVFLPPYRCWRGLLASALLHTMLIPSLPVLARLLPESEEEVWRRQALVVRPLEIHVPDVLYMPSKGPAPGPKRISRKLAAPQKPKRPETASRKDPSRRFELPELARRTDTDQTVLQPQYPPDLVLQQQVRLPNVVFWSAPQLPKPEPKRFVQPGRRTPVVTPVPALQAPPRLELPNRELAVSDLKMSGGVVSEQPALPRPPSTTMPVRVFQAPSPGAPSEEGISLDALPGDPTNLIAVSSNPAPLERALLVPPGSQLGRLPGPPGESGTGEPGEAAGEGGGTGSESRGGPSGTTGGGSEGGGAASGRGAGGDSGLGSGSGVGGSGPGGSGAGAGSGAGPGQTGGSGLGAPGQSGGRLLALSLPTPSVPAGVPARVVHPTTGVYDVVIQSSSSGILPDTAGILSGKPVYTVYVHIEAQREWILQYCRPAEAERILKSGGGVVQLSTPAPIKAPYPLVTVTPPITLEPRADPIMVHGLLDSAGRFKALRLVRDTNREIRQQLLPYLEKWEFRPGTRDGLPVLLEILLVIPANKA